MKHPKRIQPAKALHPALIALAQILSRAMVREYLEEEAPK